MILSTKHKALIVLLSTIVIYITFFTQQTFAQLNDDFSDGNFTSNPQWYGDTSKFKITTSSAIPPSMKPALQLYGDAPDTTILFTNNSLLSNTEWLFWVKLSFNTSENNYARIYLVSDNPDISGDLNGYYVNVGGATDSIALCRQSGNNSTAIIHGTIAYTGNSTNMLRVKVTRDNTGNWNLYSDPEGGYDFQQEGTAFDNTFSSTSYFGIFCKYTASNAHKFYFDDFYIGEPVNDTIPPHITGVLPITQSKADILFDEPLKSTSVPYVENYYVDQGIGNPVSAEQDNDNPALVHLEFEQSFVSGMEYTIIVSGMEDLSGNISPGDTTVFTWYESGTAKAYDIIINEIMVDESPAPAGLPAFDYMELHNRSNKTFDLSGWTIKTKPEATPIVFPSITIEPDSFLIVVKTTNVNDFESFGKVAGLPGFTLNNESSLVLRDNTGNFIHSISYAKSWYKDEDKQEGGWAIELIDPQYACAGEQNWIASMDSTGGTPGKRNSAYMSNPSIPEIESITPVGANKLDICFSHYMDSTLLLNPMAYFVSKGIGNPQSVITEPASFQRVTLSFQQNFQTNSQYSLKITDTIYDCSSNFVPLNAERYFVIPDVPQPYEIVINEILADPVPPTGLPEFEFIELYNTTGKYLGIKNWTLLIGTVEKELSEIILGPYEYIIITSNNAKPLYELFGKSYGLSSLSLPNNGTTLKLIDNNGITMSSVTYSINWYSDETKKEGGWSLEQIDPGNACAISGNWSESINKQGGTPGTKNSVDDENNTYPGIINIVDINNNTIEVLFDQNMKRSSLSNTDMFNVDNGTGNPIETQPDSQFANRVTLIFEKELSKRTVYTLETDSELKNCKDEATGKTLQKRFGITEPAGKDDIVINEVLFNPTGDGVDFVEIYNRSEKIIRPADITLGSIDENEFEPDDTIFKEIPSTKGMLFPEEYLVLTTDPDKVKEQYFTENPDGFIKMESYPSYPNEKGTVLLSTGQGSIIDYFNYNDDMHYPLLSSTEGVSLEKINFDRPSSDPTNWHSASYECGFATPAFKNSQFNDYSVEESPVWTTPEIFTPDNDGNNDIVNINYKFPQAGLNGTITIFNSQGMPVKNLVRNKLLGTEGTFTWDGSTNDHRKAPIGIYVIFFEVFDMNGKIQKFKKTTVLGGKL